MNYGTKKDHYEPLINDIKEYLFVTQYDFIKDYDLALFGAGASVFNKPYLEALDSYIHALGQRKNRPWFKQIIHKNALELFFEDALDKTFNDDVDYYLSSLRDQLISTYERIDMEERISVLRDDLETDVEAFEYNFDRFLQELKKLPNFHHDNSEYLNEIMFVDLVKSFIEGGCFEIVYRDLFDNHKQKTLTLEYEFKVWFRMEHTEGLMTFGSAGENNFRAFAKFKYQIFILNELIKSAIDYHDLQTDGFKWSVKDTLLALELIDSETYQRMGS